MFSVKSILVAAALATTAATGASAATIQWATNVIDVSRTDTIGGNNRDNPLNMIGAPDAKGNKGFFSIGLGGKVVLGFDRLFENEARLVEVTSGSRSGHQEAVKVYAGRSSDYSLGSFDFSNFTFMGRLTNDTPTSTVTLTGGPFDVLALIDDTVVPVGQTRDGWDVDAIGVMPAVPLPAGGLLLLTGLGALALRRRKTA